jgi:hypothetical protein
LRDATEARVTLFEYVAVAFSLVFSYTALRLVGGLPSALEGSRRYWVHATLVVGQLFSTAAVFWLFWSFRDVEWTFPRFLLVLASPGLVYYNACALVPENPSEVQSWRVHYFAARKRYYLGVALWALVVVTTSTLLLDMPIAHPARVVQAGALGIGVLGASTADPRAHAGIAAFLVVLMLFGGFAIASEPGALSR